MASKQDKKVGGSNREEKGVRRSVEGKEDMMGVKNQGGG